MAHALINIKHIFSGLSVALFDTAFLIYTDQIKVHNFDHTLSILVEDSSQGDKHGPLNHVSTVKLEYLKNMFAQLYEMRHTCTRATSYRHLGSHSDA